MDDTQRLKQIAILVHDLRQPMNVINLSCANIQNRAKTNLDSLDQKYITVKIAKIVNNIEKGSEILEKIYNLSR